jgi:hypothetical protein
VEGLPTARTRGRTDDADLGPETTDDLIGTRPADALEERLGFGLLGLGQ